MSDGVKSFLSVLHRALERERHFALFEEVPCQPKARSVIVSGQDLDPTHASLRSIPGSWLRLQTPPTNKEEQDAQSHVQEKAEVFGGR